MAYNLRTGLIGSGDIDINVSLSDLNAANITTGVFSSAVIPTLGNSKISDLDAAKLTGTIASARLDLLASDIPDLATTKITSGTFASSFIPNLDASKIASGTIASARLDLLTTDIPDLATTKITGGTFASSFIPDLAASKITSGSLDTGRIPDLDATKITTGTFASADRIPLLPTSKIDSSTTFAKSMINSTGTFAVSDIPNLPTTKLDAATSDLDLNGNDLVDVHELKFVHAVHNAVAGNASYKTEFTNCDLSSTTNVMPSTHDIIGYKAVAANYNHPGNTITSSYELIDSGTLMSFTVPSSRLVEIELSVYIMSLNAQSVLAMLVNGGTSDEFADEIIDDSTLTPSTKGTYMASHGMYDNNEYQMTAKWVLHFPASEVGETHSIDAQVASGSGTFTIKFGRTNVNIGYPPVIFKATALPSTAALTVLTL